MMLATLKREGGAYRPFPGPPDVVVPAWVSQHRAELRKELRVVIDIRSAGSLIVDLYYDAVPILSTTITGIRIHEQRPKLLESPIRMARRHLIEACQDWAGAQHDEAAV